MWRRRRAPICGTQNLEAYQLYLKGRHALGQRGDGIKRALDAFQRAVTLDATFALAHAGLAEAYSLLGFYGYVRESTVMPAARAAAVRALEIDPSLAEPHAPLQVVRFLYDWDWPGAAAEFDLAMAKNPNAPGPMVYRAVELATVHGRFDEALAIAGRIAALDPLSPYSYHAEALVHYTAERFEDTLAAIAQADAIHPNLWITVRLAGMAKSELGDHSGAVADLTRATELSGHHPWLYANLASVHDRHGDAGEARRWAEAGLALRERRYVQPSGLALCCGILRRFDEAFAWLERACVERDLLPLLNHFGIRRNALAHDPRWPALMRRIGLDPPRL